MRVLVAGATGVVGRQLVPRLIAAGHQVTGTTRSPAKTGMIRAAGAEAVVVDGLDGAAVGEAVARAEPEAIVHEMTAIPLIMSMRRFDRTFAVTNELRTRGLDHLLAAAAAAGVRRVVAQSYAGWNMRSGGPVTTEDDPLDDHALAGQRESLAAIVYLERAVQDVAGIDGLALRYGSLYGPGASDQFVELVRKRRLPVIGDGGGIWSFLHVEDAATATVAAVERGAPGVYNVVDDDPAPVRDWLPALAAAVGARPPLRVPVWIGRLAAGEVAVSMMTQARGFSNAKATRELGWRPRWASWRDGFVQNLDPEPAGERPRG